MKSLRLLLLVALVIVPMVFFFRSNCPKSKRLTKEAEFLIYPDGHIGVGSVPSHSFFSAKENAIFVPSYQLERLEVGKRVTLLVEGKKGTFTVQKVESILSNYTNPTGSEYSADAFREPMTKIYVKESVAPYR